MENLLYTLIQIAHNFGAVAVTGSPAAGWFLERRGISARRVAFVLLAGWLLQGISGVGFAIISYCLKGALPEVAGVALWALSIKIIVTVIGFALSIIMIKRGEAWRIQVRVLAWQALLTATVAALAAAAVLRWYL